MNRINVRKGVGEIIGFAVVIPFILVLILFIVNVFQIALCEEKLIYAAYRIGRQAVVSYTEPLESDPKINDILSSIFNDTSKVKHEISPRGGWIKGNMVLVKVSYDFHGAVGFQNGTHERQIAMMIEHSHWGSDW